MAFFSKVGNAVRQTLSKQLSSDLKATANLPIYQAIRCMSSSKLFIGGLSYGTDETSLREAFGNYGQVVEARVILDRETGRSRGFGFVTYTSSEEASAAIQALDGQDLHGRRVRVNYAADRAPRMPPGYGGGTSYGGPYGGGGVGSGFGGYDNAGGNFGGNDYQNNGYGMGGTPDNYNPGGFGSNGNQNSSPGNFGAGGGFDSFASGGNFSSSGGAGGNVSADSRFTSSRFDAGLGHSGGDQFGSNGTNEHTDEQGAPVNGVFKDDSESGVPIDKEDYEHDYAKRA